MNRIQINARTNQTKAGHVGSKLLRDRLLEKKRVRKSPAKGMLRELLA